jgi:predicted negative regulator of RcsB-dependent stress response
MTRHDFFSRTAKPVVAAVLLAVLAYAGWQIGAIDWARLFG